MSLRELVNLNHPVHAYFYVVGVLTSTYVLAWAIWFVLVGAVHILQTLISEWLVDEPEQLRFPQKGH